MINLNEFVESLIWMTLVHSWSLASTHYWLWGLLPEWKSLQAYYSLLNPTVQWVEILSQRGLLLSFITIFKNFPIKHYYLKFIFIYYRPQNSNIFPNFIWKWLVTTKKNIVYIFRFFGLFRMLYIWTWIRKIQLFECTFW